MDAATVGTWPEPSGEVRTATHADVETIRPLHDREFPASYATAEHLVPETPDGKFQVVVAADGPQLLGYAAGRVQPDGEGYLDFIAVADVARGRGVGRDLMAAVCRPVIAGVHHRQAAPDRPGPPHPRPPPVRVPRLPEVPLDRGVPPPESG